MSIIKFVLGFCFMMFLCWYGGMDFLQRDIGPAVCVFGSAVFGLLVSFEDSDHHDYRRRL